MYNFSRYPKPLYLRVNRYPTCDGLDYIRYIQLRHYTGSIVEWTIPEPSFSQIIELDSVYVMHSSVSNLRIHQIGDMDSVDDSAIDALELAIELSSFDGESLSVVSEIQIHLFSILYLNETPSDESDDDTISSIDLVHCIDINDTDQWNSEVSIIDGVFSYIGNLSAHHETDGFDDPGVSVKSLEYLWLDSVDVREEDSERISHVRLSPQNILLESIDASQISQFGLSVQRFYHFIIWFWDR